MCPQEAGEGMVQLHPEIQVNPGLWGWISGLCKSLGGEGSCPLFYLACCRCCLLRPRAQGQCQSEDPRANAVCAFHCPTLRNTITTTRILGVYYLLDPAPTPNINYLIEPSPNPREVEVCR